MTTAPTGAERALGIALDSVLLAHMRSDSVPGFAIAVTDGVRTVLSRGYGLADREAGIAMTDTTPLNIASVSKPITALAVLQLAQRGRIGLDEPVERYLSRWRIPVNLAYPTREVTVRRLLMHTGGLSVPSVPFFPLDSARPSLESVLSGAAGDRGPVSIIKRPGETWSYSGGGFTVLELMMEEVTGSLFNAHMHTAIFTPLGMDRSSFDPASDQLAIAVGYDENGKAIQRHRWVGEAAAGLYTTARDFGRLLEAYAAMQSGQAGAPLSQAWFALLARPGVAIVLPGVETGGAEYSLGHMTASTQSNGRAVYHSGGNPGFAAYFIYSLDRRAGVFVVSNSERGIDGIRAAVAQWGKHYGVNVPPIF